MLTARTKSGKTICLGNDYMKDTLLFLREKEEFICPVCGEGISLKLGDQRIYHFAHKRGGMCRDFYESETLYHMQGKRQLFQWLIRQRIPSSLEFYDTEIQQRPDIMFKYNGVKYALEFQCSPIPEDIFMKRTKNYLDHDYVPLWILGSKHMKSKRGNIVSLSYFHYFFLRDSFNGHPFIPSYCPDNRNFHLVGSILPYSIKNAFTDHITSPVDKIGVAEFLEPQFMNTLNTGHWKDKLETSNLNWSLHPSPEQNRFLHEIYNKNLNLFLLPPIIGLPIRHSLLILTNPTVWQTYLFLDVIKGKKTGDYIHLAEIERCFTIRINKKEIIIRKLLQLQKVNPLIAVKEYLLLLKRIGILIQKDDTVFQLQEMITIPRTNRESTEQKSEFYQKYQHILSKL